MPMEVGVIPPVIAAIAASVFMMARVEHRSPSALGLPVEPAVAGDVAVGLAIGALPIVVVTMIEVVFGWVSWVTGPDTIGVALLLLVATTLFLFVAAFAEELLFRGYPIQVLGRRFGAVVAVAATSVVFAAAHLANPNSSWLSFANTALAGILLGIVYWRTWNLWLATAVHAGWNLAMAALGLSVSGLSIGGVGLIARTTGPELLTGGAYGPEGGLLVTFVTSGAIALVARTGWLRRRESILRLHPLPEGSDSHE